jgi:hypothetical protein
MVLLSSAIAAERGRLTLWVVMVIAFSGTLISDWSYFFLGRYLGINWINKKSFFQRKAEIVHMQIRKSLMLVLLSYRFLYGLRIITPFIPGTSNVKKKTLQEPAAGGFRNHSLAKYTVRSEWLFVDKAQLLTVTTPKREFLSKVCVLNTNFNNPNQGVFTERPEVLSNDFF